MKHVTWKIYARPESQIPSSEAPHAANKAVIFLEFYAFDLSLRFDETEFS